jgi:type I restriction enzyme S subunit
MINWKLIKFRDFIELQRGHDLPSSERIDGPYPVIGSAGINGYHNVAKVSSPGVTLGRSGASFGKAFFVNEDYWPHNACLYVKNFKGNDKKFVYYFLKVNDFSSLNSGSAQPSLNRNILYCLSIKIPNLQTQKKIASILSAYDDLIENNNQRIQLLEEMAEDIYKEWFVRLRFPGYETCRFFDKNGAEVGREVDGALPEGWEKERIEDAFTVVGGGTPSTIEDTFWKNGTVNWFSPTDITGAKGIFLKNSAKKITPLGLKKSAAKIFPPKSLMMTSRATIGAIGINITEACTNQGFITCIPNENFPYTYIYHWIKINKKLIENFASGATFKEISRGVFKNFKIIKPKKSLISSFHNIVSPMFDELSTLQQKNQVLQETRDLLLPRLISGKLDVSEMEVAI